MRRLLAKVARVAHTPSAAARAREQARVGSCLPTGSIEPRDTNGNVLATQERSVSVPAAHPPKSRSVTAPTQRSVSRLRHRQRRLRRRTGLLLEDVAHLDRAESLLEIIVG